jgi:hypothetical protein
MFVDSSNKSAASIIGSIEVLRGDKGQWMKYH